MTLLEAIILGAVIGLLVGVGIGAWRSRGDD